MPSEIRRSEGIMVRMGFHDRAWNAAAEEYGRKRAEKYGAVARFIRTVQVGIIIALIIAIWVLWASR
jgi:hypothetical protein